ncbi:MAG TPA: hypothetical protein VM165_10545 [Planctomycetaceae bacterium]|nr:hypothetical protein [Planctomycetaceae bacterium]
MVQALNPTTVSRLRYEELRAELALALQQRQTINNPRIQQLLDNHIRDLQASLIVFGRS